MEGGRRLCKHRLSQNTLGWLRGTGQKALGKGNRCLQQFHLWCTQKGEAPFTRLSPFREIHANIVLQPPHGKDWLGSWPQALSHLPAILYLGKTLWGWKEACAESSTVLTPAMARQRRMGLNSGQALQHLRGAGEELQGLQGRGVTLQVPGPL